MPLLGQLQNETRRLALGMSSWRSPGMSLHIPESGSCHFPFENPQAGNVLHIAEPDQRHENSCYWTPETNKSNRPCSILTRTLKVKLSHPRALPCNQGRNVEGNALWAVRALGTHPPPDRCAFSLVHRSCQLGTPPVYTLSFSEERIVPFGSALQP